MRYLILSDIHANHHALTAVIDDATRRGYDRVLVLGDLVGYGADPGLVMDTIHDLDPAAVIRGNHDKVCAGLEPATLFNDVARQSAEWTSRTLSRDHVDALAALPQGPLAIDDTLEICHGSPFDEDYYLFDVNDAARAVEAASRRWCLFGHTHVPTLFATAEHPAEPVPDPDGEVVHLPAAGPVIANVGAVGQPRDGDPRAAYGILDMREGTLAFRRVAYDIAAAQARIRAEGLPDWLADRLERGQ